jgi:hypothetical protein
MDFDLPDDTHQLRDIVAADSPPRPCSPHARQWDREMALPDALVQELGGARLLGVLRADRVWRSGLGISPTP